MNRIIFGQLLLVLFFFNSCMVGKKVTYVSDMQPDSAYVAAEVKPLTVQQGDRLQIVVQAKNAELAAPFNSVEYRVDNVGNVSANSASGGTSAGYLVDRYGKIELPVLGSMRVEGLSLDELRALVNDRLIEDGFIAAPLVSVNLLNFRVSVSGAVLRENVIEVSDQRITLLEAIAMSGGLKPNAAPDRVNVIRHEKGVRKLIIANVESKALFDSPAYYLKQNDVVFIEPKTADKTPKEDRSWRFLSTSLSAIAIVLTAINLMK